MGRDPGRRLGPGDAETSRDRERTGRPRHPGGPQGVRGDRPRLSLKPRPLHPAAPAGSWDPRFPPGPLWPGQPPLEPGSPSYCLLFTSLPQTHPQLQTFPGGPPAFRLRTPAPSAPTCPPLSTAQQPEIRFLTFSGSPPSAGLSSFSGSLFPSLSLSLDPQLSRTFLPITARPPGLCPPRSLSSFL